MSQSKRRKPANNRKNRKQSDPHHEREKAKYGAPIASREFILDLLRKEKAPMRQDKLAEKLGLGNDETGLEALRRRVGAMLRDGQLIENRKNGLVPVDAEALIAGRISAHPDGFGFLVADDSDGKSDIYLSATQMKQVMHGDRAVACITGVDRRGRREGRIVEVVERANKSLVGKLFVEKGVVFVTPDNKRLTQDLMIAPDARGDAEHGDIVVAEIIEQPTRKHPPVGRVAEVLGKHMQPGMEIDMSLRSHEIPFEWPDAVTTQAAAFSATVQNNDKMGRKDITRLPLVTIDGADARDFDDAVYCEKNKNGWRLLVAIADVAHYVVPGTALDDEAQNRGTSVYFPGRVVPMLPEVLSNGLCSINPDVERLCMLCEMTLDDTGAIKRARFYNGLMLSHARLTYSQVNSILLEDDDALLKKHHELVPHLKALHELYQVLASNRQRRGAIEFDSTETRILFDENKKISEIVPIVRNDAHKLIEECMILANVAAAGFLEQHSLPALFRVHHSPKSERLEDLRAFLSLRGLSLGGGNMPTALDYAALAKLIEDRPDRSVISTVMLRSMQQAVYQPRNDGHFGLALTQYAHFTSPIRRYPDLLVHRAIKHVLKREPMINYHYSKEQMQSLGESCSMFERRADEATRDVTSWLKCEYMQDHVGSEFPGVITAVTSFGLFVDLQGIHIEGLIHVTNLSHDYYRYEQAAQAMVGENTGKQYKLGDSITVRVEAVNLDERKIDFSEAGVEKSAKPKKQRDKKSKDDKRKKAKHGKVDNETEQVGKSVWPARKKDGSKADKRKRKSDTDTSAHTDTVADNVKTAAAAKKAPATASAVDKKKTSSRKVGKKAASKASTANGSVKKKTAAKKASSGKAAGKNEAATSKKSSNAKSKATDKSTLKNKANTNKASEKPASKKASGKKKIARKADAVKASTRKTAARQATADKAVARKVAAKKPAGKKVAGKKTSASKTSGKKTASKKVAAKKHAAKKTSNKLPAAKKTASSSTARAKKKVRKKS